MKSTFWMTAQETEDEIKSRGIGEDLSQYPFSAKMQFCSQHNKTSNIIDVDQCRECVKPGYAAGHPLAPKQATLRFFWNGIKVNGGKLQLCHYSDSALMHSPAGTLTIYARNYRRFSAEIRDAFKVENGSDMMTDYFENDHIRVEPTHPLYAQVKAGVDAWHAHYAKRDAKAV